MFTRLWPSLALVLAVSCATPPTASPSASDAGVDADVGSPIVDLPAPSNGEGTIRRLAAGEKLPLSGYRVDAKPGDWVLTNGARIAVVSAAKGRVVDFGVEGGADDLGYIEATAFDGLDKMHSELRVIEQVGEGGRVLHVEHRLLERPLVHHAWIAFMGGTLRIESMLVSTGEAVLAATLGEVLAWGNTPTWVADHGFITRSGSFAGALVARQSAGVSYAACRAKGRLVARFDAEDLPGFHESASTGEETASVPAHGATPRRTLFLAVATRSLGDAALALPCLSTLKHEHYPLPSIDSVSRAIEIAHTGSPRGVSPYLRFDVDGDRHDLDLPEGSYDVRFTAPGHAPGPWTTLKDVATASNLAPTAGRLEVHVTDASGAALPAKILIRGLAPTTDPSFGDDPDRGAAVNAVYSEGDTTEALPPGHYRVYVHHGPEYDAHDEEIHVEANKSVVVKAKLEHVVDTKGFVSADLHVHAVPSFDAPVPLEDRVRSLAAVGVEVAVATDHNAITDYGPAIQSLGMGSRIASIVGDEVTTKEVSFGHFNVFPLTLGDKPIPFESISPTSLFAAARAAPPVGPKIIQVNHPRMGGIGYFELLRLDPGDVGAWKDRAPLADMGFDAIEVFNGDHYASIDKVERAMRDWYALLNAGFRTTATGNSDSHKLVFQEAGVPRNWVSMPNDDPRAFDEHAFVESVRQGRVVVSSGPFIRLEANGKTIGDSIDPGDVAVSVRVEAPAWIDVDHVEILRRGEPLASWDGAFSGSPRFEKKIDVKLAKGDWIIAIARGTKAMTALYRPDARPFGFTNPIWVR